MDGSLVHCHRGFEFESRHHTLFFFVFRSDIFINYLFIDIIHNYFQTIFAAEYRFNAELMHSLASRICNFVFDNVPFNGHFV